MLILKVYGVVHERKGTKKDGTSFTFAYQEAEIVKAGHRPRVVKVSVPNQGRYEEGLYTLAADSFRPDKYERLELGFVELVAADGAIAEAEKQLKALTSSKLV